MRKAIRRSLELFAECFQPRGPVVELGSFYTPEYQWLSDLRPLFPGREYIGCDIRAGHGVDRIESAEALGFADGFAGTMILCEILEHLPDPDAALAEAWRVLGEDGLLVVSVPFQYRLHGFPTDYWRFTSSGVHTMLAAFPNRTVFALGPRLKPALVFAVAAKAGTRDFDARAQRFEQRVAAEFAASRLRGAMSEFKHRGRDFFGLMLGRAELGAAFFRPDESAGYRRR